MPRDPLDPDAPAITWAEWGSLMGAGFIAGVGFVWVLMFLVEVVRNYCT